MPIYVYQCTEGSGCALCGVGFEKLQRLNAPPIKRCPHCNAPVGKVVSAPNLATGGADISDQNVERHGFTRYRKVEKGVYEKTAGKGPGMIKRED